MKALAIISALSALLLFSTSAAAQTDLSGYATTGADSFVLGEHGWTDGGGTHHMIVLCDTASGTAYDVFGVDTAVLIDDITMNLDTGNDNFEVLTADRTVCGELLVKLQYDVYTVTVNGDGGDDTLTGGIGVDYLWGDVGSCDTGATGGNDRLTARGGTDRVHGCGGSDVLLADITSGINPDYTSNAILIGGFGADCLGLVNSGSPVTFPVHTTSSRCGGNTTVGDTGDKEAISSHLTGYGTLNTKCQSTSVSSC